MSHPENQLKLPVACLRPGLYVAALDRPWLDTPFLFQGFAIRETEEVRTLGNYCDFVYIDADQSDPDELQAARRDAERDAARPGKPTATSKQATPPERHDEASQPEENDHKRFPTGTRFRESVAAAKAGRDQARQAVDRLMADLRFGKSVDTKVARKAVEELVSRVSADASAALWLTSLKDRDEYTSIHCVNVCVLALAFGLHLGLDRSELVNLGTGALLHDVGKTRTPDAILNKPGPLDEREFEIMKRHAEDGYRLLAAGGGTAREVLDIVRLHHERLPGTGYPFGLKGEEIPLAVRVVAVVDTYDAMTSDRAYRDAISADDALNQLYRHEHAAFGTDLIEAFIRCLGIFPVGSVVELDNGAIGVVVKTRPDARLRPTLRMVRTPDGEAYDKRLLVNLAEASPAGEYNPASRIARALTPASANVDIAPIVMAEADPLTDS
ncbi:HD-GYP domain-containing protein [Halofilum ochraceum]|uniref:HD-GYP domain-containing protein n=1 Tax=Halofilum ochraceum TaxID=1611323 RepID=UPI00158602EC|nr:HD-GYP domain-containing protein [Halofilum ochraceum]